MLLHPMAWIHLNFSNWMLNLKLRIGMITYRVWNWFLKLGSQNFFFSFPWLPPTGPSTKSCTKILVNPLVFPWTKINQNQTTFFLTFSSYHSRLLGLEKGTKFFKTFAWCCREKPTTLALKPLWFSNFSLFLLTLGSPDFLREKMARVWLIFPISWTKNRPPLVAYL